MKIGPKYKIAKRLGASVFEKTQNPKFALHVEKKNASLEGVRSRSGYGAQLLEKQKVRFTYGITAKQLTNYVKNVISSDAKNQEEALYQNLERRLDNIVLKSGFAKSRRLARQLVSHGHIRVNDKKVTVPSYDVKKGDLIKIKDSSKEKAVFADVKELAKEITVPAWLKVDLANLSTNVTGEPQYKSIDTSFNLSEVLQFYKR